MSTAQVITSTRPGRKRVKGKERAAARKEKISRLILFPELRERGIPYSREHLRRLMLAGQFPQRRQLSEGRVGWIEAEIDAWIETRPQVKSPEPA